MLPLSTFRSATETKKGRKVAAVKNFGMRMNEQRALLVGLDGSGKTTMLYHEKLNEKVTTIPTIGFNVETIENFGHCKRLDLTMWDIGGQRPLQPLWRHYYQGTNVALYAVDSTDRARLSESVTLFENMMAEPDMKDVPAVIIATKQDLPAPMSKENIASAFEVDKRVAANPSQMIRVVAAAEGKYSEVEEAVLEMLGIGVPKPAGNIKTQTEDDDDDEHEAQLRELRERRLFQSYHRLSRVLEALSHDENVLPLNTGGGDNNSAPVSYVDDNVSKPVCFSGVPMPVEIIGHIISFLDFTCLVPPKSYHATYELLRSEKKKDDGKKTGSNFSPPPTVSPQVIAALSVGESLWRVNKSLLAQCLNDATLRLLRLLQDDETAIDERILTYVFSGTRSFFFLNVPLELQPAHLRFCTAFMLLVCVSRSSARSGKTGAALRNMLQTREILYSIMHSSTFSAQSTSLYKIFVKATTVMMYGFTYVAHTEEREADDDNDNDENGGAIDGDGDSGTAAAGPRVRALFDVDLGFKSDTTSRIMESFIGGTNQGLADTRGNTSALDLLDFWFGQVTEGTCWFALNTFVVDTPEQRVQQEHLLQQQQRLRIERNNENKTEGEDNDVSATTMTSNGVLFCPIQLLCVPVEMFRFTQPAEQLIRSGRYQDIFLHDTEEVALSHCALAAFLDVIVGVSPYNHTQLVRITLHHFGAGLWALLKVLPFAAPNIRFVRFDIYTKGVRDEADEVAGEVENIVEVAKASGRWTDCSWELSADKLTVTTQSDAGKGAFPNLYARLKTLLALDH